MGATLRGRFKFGANAATAFDQFVEDLVTGLHQQGLTFTPGPSGQIAADANIVARVETWQPGERIKLAWSQSDSSDSPPMIEVSLRTLPSGTEVVFEVRNWTTAIGPWGDVSGWFGSQLAAPLIHALTPAAVGEWVTDRVARRPSGRQARETYRDPLYHYPNFRVILEELALTSNDVLLDVGCGGGALLHEGLKRGCQAAGIDHSPEMVQVARELNRVAVTDGRVHVVHGRADQLPFDSNSFTCAAMTGVLGFLSDPVGCLMEIRRVLNAGGRFVMLGSDRRLRGTPAAPEPIASHLCFYDDEDLENMSRAAGFSESTVIRRDLSSHARAVGVPEEHIELFAGPTSFLVARKL
jgi:SAM-dependent methyltransferase